MASPSATASARPSPTPSPSLSPDATDGGGGNGAVDDPCAADYSETYDMALHIWILFAIMLCSFAGTMLPVVGRRFKLLGKINDLPFQCGKMFGAGVILATAWVHMFAPADQALTNPCLPPLFTADYTSWAGALALLAALSTHLIQFLASRAIRQQLGRGHQQQEKVLDRFNPESELVLSQSSPPPPLPPALASEGASQSERKPSSSTAADRDASEAWIVSTVGAVVGTDGIVSHDDVSLSTASSLSGQDRHGTQPRDALSQVVTSNNTATPDSVAAAEPPVSVDEPTATDSKPQSVHGASSSSVTIAVMQDASPDAARAPSSSGSGMRAGDGHVAVGSLRRRNPANGASHGHDHGGHHGALHPHNHAAQSHRAPGADDHTTADEHGHHLMLLKEKHVTTYMLELGIATHSIIIGLTLGVARGNEVRSLAVALVFHQFFEGLALSTVVLESDFGRNFVTFGMVLFYTLTTPFGIALGIGINAAYNTNAQNALLAQGILDALSAGILAYDALVNIIFMHFSAPALRLQSDFAQFLQLGSLWLGAFVMALLGRWA